MDAKVMQTGVLSSGRVLYPLLVIAAIAVTVLSAVGIAAMTGLLPSAAAGKGDQVVAQQPAAAEPAAAPAPAPVAEPAPAPCDNCGVVESVRAVQTQGHSSGLGAVAGGVVGGLLGNMIGAGTGNVVATIAGAAGGAFAGNEVEKNAHQSTRFRVRVRMDDGSRRTVYQHGQPSVAVGQKVKVDNGTVVAQG
ncbi:MAG TPA: glycine zipper 2TM domain-containing protein [Burkholderiales bacterium]|nr:glycine zipper 2TM domain-containing protein [Burkholderiales bacterium]